MRLLPALIRNRDAAAAAEMALVLPFFIALMFGSMELGNYFVTQHAVTKQVRDGARYASRLTLSDEYSCPSSVFEDPDANAKIINVTKYGAVSGTGSPRFNDDFWAPCADGEPVSVSIRCVASENYSGIYATLDGDIPVVSVRAAVSYPSLFGSLGFNAADLCVGAASEVVVAGL